ncbi:hypothetical protein [Promicromonospora soli]|uniref:Uncharacterized protein n=1 Tax=Promicromonospora soli TaxID=2035533 RepID=A0A919KT35_9MICO|nr:hypothetical protein [Promicromonospora soli]GHH71529.1 hypothetical protein GCM10017772_20080 [Promicromonospora soli]
MLTVVATTTDRGLRRPKRICTSDHEAVMGRDPAWRWTVLLVALSTAVSGCTAAGPQVRPGAEDASRVESGVIDVAPGEHNSIGTVTLCTENTGAGEITAVTTPPGSGVEVVAYSVANEPSDIGGLRGRLESLGADTTSHTVERKCRAEGETGAIQVATLLIEVVAQDDRSARADHLTIHWEADGNTGEFDVQWAILLCTTVDQESKDFCQQHLED